MAGVDSRKRLPPAPASGAGAFQKQRDRALRTSLNRACSGCRPGGGGADKASRRRARRLNICNFRRSQKRCPALQGLPVQFLRRGRDQAAPLRPGHGPLLSNPSDRIELPGSEHDHREHDQIASLFDCIQEVLNPVKAAFFRR